MTFSLNEIEATGKRAARGAGHEWGIAEEAGKAARWLTAHGLPGPELLAELLTQIEGEGYAELAPVSAEGVWQARSGRLCPLIAGAALSDRAAEIAAGRVIETGPIAFPLLLAPYVACGARPHGVVFELTWLGVTLALAPDGLAIAGAEAALSARTAGGVKCRVAAGVSVPPRAARAGRAVDAETWSRLSTFAHRTLAPATEASRLAGAGAGLTDND
ncbi:MAG: DUF3726 domain-containing protein [Paracoccaceae bacterium]